MGSGNPSSQTHDFYFSVATPSIRISRNLNSADMLIGERNEIKGPRARCSVERSPPMISKPALNA